MRCHISQPIKKLASYLGDFNDLIDGDDPGSGSVVRLDDVSVSQAMVQDAVAEVMAITVAELIAAAEATVQEPALVALAFRRGQHSGGEEDYTHLGNCFNIRIKISNR